MRCHLVIAPYDLLDLCVSGCALWCCPATAICTGTATIGIGPAAATGQCAG
jgi:hypothetical protein